jgi:hypothetical protein
MDKTDIAEVEFDRLTVRGDISRIETPFPAIIRGVDAYGHSFEECTVLDGLSALGLSVRTRHEVVQGSRLFVCIRLGPYAHPKDKRSTAYLAVHGAAAYVEYRPGGAFGIEVLFTHSRFIPPTS